MNLAFFVSSKEVPCKIRNNGCTGIPLRLWHMHSYLLSRRKHCSCQRCHNSRLCTGLPCRLSRCLEHRHTFPNPKANNLSSTWWIDSFEADIRLDLKVKKNVRHLFCWCHRVPKVRRIYTLTIQLQSVLFGCKESKFECTLL